MRKEIISTTGVAIAARLIGFVIPVVVAALFGSSSEADAFFFVYALVICLRLVVGHVFEAVIVPHLMQEIAAGKSPGDLLSVTITRTTLVILIALAPALVGSKFLIAQLTGWEDPQVLLASQLWLVMFPCVILMSWTSQLNGCLNAERDFHATAISPVFRSTVMLLCMVLLHQRLGVLAIAIGFAIGEFARFLFAWLMVRRRGHHVRPVFAASDASRLFFGSAAFQTVGFGLLSLVPIVNQIFAARLPTGDLSVFSYAVQLRSGPAMLVTFGLGTVVLTHWAEQHSRGSSEFDWRPLRGQFVKMVLASLGLALVLCLLAYPIAQLMLGWGRLSEANVSKVAWVFAILVLGLPIDVLTVLSVRIFIILRADLAYLLLAACKLLLVVGLNALLVPQFGIVGIGITLLLAGVVHVLCLLWCIRVRMVPRAGPPAPEPATQVPSQVRVAAPAE